MSDLDKQLEDMTRDELVKLVQGCEHLLKRVLDIAGEVVGSWGALSPSERLAGAKRIASPAIINPRPLNADALEGLRRMGVEDSSDES